MALVPLPKFHLTRYYGVFAPASPHRKNLPDRPRSGADGSAEQSDDSSDAPHKSKLGGGKKGGKSRMGWAALLKRTFNIDVLQCPQCSGRMKLVEVVMSGERIRDTLVAIGVSPRPPPIAPARTPGLFGFEEFADTDSCWPDDNESEATPW